MKKLVNNFKYACLSMAILFFASCQEEFEEVSSNQEETITVGSSVANLMANTSAQDGSFDNIVDQASCFAIQFPYTVEVANIQITIDALEDLRTIEALFDEFDDDEDLLAIVFPITIVYEDFSELVIENAEQLRQLASECVEGGDDDDIECIDFVYPITLFTFDINQQQTGDVEINSDKELRRFLNNAQPGEIVSIDFPILMKKFDGTEIEIVNNAQLAMVLNQAKDECDEDDDNDFNDDDFDEDRFVSYLTECDWKLRDIRRFGMEQIGQYPGFTFDFDEDGTFYVENENDLEVEGQWSFEFTENGPLVQLSLEDYPDFSATWLVYEIDENKIKFFSDNENRIIFKRKCDDDDHDDDDDDDDDNDDDDNVLSDESLRSYLKTCTWLIGELRQQGELNLSLFGAQLVFGEEGQLTLIDGEEETPGTYEIYLNDEGIRTLSIVIEGDSILNYEWPLYDVDDYDIEEINYMKFYDENTFYSLKLFIFCEDEMDNEVTEIRSAVLENEWEVASYEVNDEDKTEDFAGVTLDFNEANELVASINQDPIVDGLWRVRRDRDGDLKMLINLGDFDPYGQLTHRWEIEEISTTEIEIVFEDDEITKVVILEKL